jgi:hypothetical protein
MLGENLFYFHFKRTTGILRQEICVAIRHAINELHELPDGIRLDTIYNLPEILAEIE